MATESLRSDASLRELPLESTAGIDVAARTTADLGWELLVAGAERNRVIAPSSLGVTLAMLAEGATGETLTGLDALFGLGADERSAAVGALRQSLDGYDSLPASVDVDDPPDEPVVHQASQVVIIDDKPVGERFLERLAAYYDAGAERVAYDDAKAALDEWARTHTAGLIEESGIRMEPRIKVVLQDAILFAAAWREVFTDDTGTMPFDGPDGLTSVPALRGEFNVAFIEGDAWEAVRLPYDDALAMDVILPARSVDPASLSAQQLDDIRRALDEAAPVSVSVTMPPCDLTAKWDLLGPLAEQGLTFDQLDGIFSGGFAAQFCQQVKLMVSAKGTVGAGVTEVAVAESASVTEMELVVDRPYIMRVLDTRTGWPFFLAIVNDAAAAVTT
ncbi:hypothetical protein LKO27_08840 [Tessaracoccus sp. OS52]|uniref:serpin family protein n=1 Tax=Tessaracoccus sp. OS52 TaxID=2886691 RepID=UPI001D1195A4|nr:hypothetical protein [Tessaracoccus sp. OS52]